MNENTENVRVIKEKDESTTIYVRKANTIDTRGDVIIIDGKKYDKSFNLVIKNVKKVYLPSDNENTR